MTAYLNEVINTRSDSFVIHYDELPLWSAPFGLLLLQNIPLRHDAIVLDVGCGTGFPLVQLAARLGPRAFIQGIDPWEQAIDRARSKIKFANLKNVHAEIGSAVKTNFADNTFDLIVSNLGINNFENPIEVVAECQRILKPGGTIAITTNLFGHMRQFYEVYRQILIEIGKRELVPKLDHEEAHRTTVKSATQLFLTADLTNTKTIESSFSMRYANGSALLNDEFTKLAFLESWRSILPEEEQPSIFELLENRLNKLATDLGYLELSIPIAYLEFQKAASAEEN